MGDRIKPVAAMPILEREYSNLDRDFNLFFPEFQQHLKTGTIGNFELQSIGLNTYNSICSIS
ncbi:hypothetical protein [Chamaesiphon sp. VAR_48_metabat_403]|uniref:hypothetical protein n=1 Tax=Chamaesiphon sp. VAR_48_metabat_403 TaxID=2964700 RepID=UPI00286DCC79|nr:hypothetical protein [Chamaesiphon sp. VAR_48_metabat_403]